MKFIKAVAAVFLGSASLVAGQNIIDVAVFQGFDTFVAAIGAAGLIDTFTTSGLEYTVFAPTDAAFVALPPGALTTLLKAENVGLLTQILRYHVVSGAVLSADLTDGLEVETLNGASLAIGVDTTVTVNGIVVLIADVKADNGVIHVIGQVLLPPDLDLPPSIVGIAARGGFNTLVDALQAADLVDALKGEGPFTVFAPTEEAFAKLPNGVLEFLLKNHDILATVLSYHVVVGNFLSRDLNDGQVVPTLSAGTSLTVSFDMASVMVNDATVVGADKVALNGVVHVIDTVLIPEGVMITPSLPHFSDSSSDSSSSGKKGKKHNSSGDKKTGNKRKQRRRRRRKDSSDSEKSRKK